MKRILAIALLALPASAQTPFSSFDPARIQEQLAQAERGLEAAHVFLGTPFAQDSAPGYDAGLRALDSRKYEAAIQSFDSVIAAKSPRADGALYWKAYALDRLGKRDDALAAIAALGRDYPKSRWLNDAQALQVEVKQSSGKPVSPADESNEDLKLIAINGLMEATPERAVPLLEGVLKGTATPQVKDRAMFVLAESPSSRAQQVLADYAKGAGNPDLQMRAIRYLGIEGTAERQQLLVSLYSGAADTGVKRAIVQSLFIAGAAGKLVDLARKERDPEMKKTIVRQLSLMGGKEATDYMLELLK